MNMTKLKDIDIYKIGNTIQMVGAVYAGEGRTLVCFFPEDRPSDGALPSDVETLDMDQDDWARFLRQTDLMEVEILAKASDGTLAKAIIRKSARQIEQGVSWNVFRRDGYRCRYCGNDKVPLTVDHLVRWEDHGPSIEENLVAACRKCNKVRGDTDYADWLKHPHYLRVSAGIDEATKRANEALVGTLDRIPRVKNLKSR
jgi:hypothetical protein